MADLNYCHDCQAIKELDYMVGEVSVEHSRDFTTKGAIVLAYLRSKPETSAFIKAFRISRERIQDFGGTDSEGFRAEAKRLADICVASVLAGERSIKPGEAYEIETPDPVMAEVAHG